MATHQQISGVQKLDEEFAFDFCARYVAAWNSRDAGRLLELLTDGIVWEEPTLPDHARGHGEVRRWLEALWRAMPDLEFTTLEDRVYVSLDGPHAAAPWTMVGTLTGALDPPGFAPTGRPVIVSGIDLFEFEGERASRIRTIYDSLVFARQIGAAPEPGTRNERIGVRFQRLAARSMRREAKKMEARGTLAPNAVRLHRCPVMFNKLPAHPCWRVQRALDETGIPYELIKQPVLRPRRKEVIERTGQHFLPMIEFADRSVLREESADMAERIRSGQLFEDRPAARAE